MGTPSNDGAGMRFLMVTTKDYRRIWNGCEHGRARHYPDLGVSYSVLYKTQAQSSATRDVVRDAVTFRTRKHRDGVIEQLEVDPWLNFFEGLVTHSSNAEGGGEEESSARPRVGLGGLIKRLLRPLGAMRFVFLPLCMTSAALVRFRGRFDVAFGSGPWAALTAWLLRRLGKARLFLYLDRDFEPGLMPDDFRGRWTGWLENFLIRRADLAVCVSHRLADRRHAECGRRPLVKPNGVDWDRFAAARERKIDSERIVYVGHVADWSGLELILEAFVPLLESHPQARLQVIGGGRPAYLNGLERAAEELGIAHAVDFLGSQPNERLPELLGGAAIGLANSAPSPYRVYACPLKVMEYMAAGVPVLATTETEAADLLERSAAGISVPHERAATTDAFARLLGDRARLIELAENGIEHTRRLRWSDIVEWELAIIRQRLGRSGGAPALAGEAPHEPSPTASPSAAGDVRA